MIVQATPESRSTRAAAPPRRWRRFSLRSLLIATTVLAVVLGMFMVCVRTQQQAVAVIEELGGRVTYEPNWLGRVLPEAMQKRLRQDACAMVVGVHLSYRTVDGLMTGLTTAELTAAVEAVSRLPYARRLWTHNLRLEDADVARLAPLRHQIEELSINELHPGGWRGSDLEPLSGWSRLRELSVLLWNPDRSVDLQPLAANPKLTTLSIGKAFLHDEAFRDIAGIESLRMLRLVACTFDGEDLRHLQRLPNLATLALDNIDVKVEHQRHRMDKEGNLQPYGAPSIRFLPSGRVPQYLSVPGLRDRFQKRLKALLPNVKVVESFGS